jgi:hypothetical protein
MLEFRFSILDDLLKELVHFAIASVGLVLMQLHDAFVFGTDKVIVFVCASELMVASELAKDRVQLACLAAHSVPQFLQIFNFVLLLHYL